MRGTLVWKKYIKQIIMYFFFLKFNFLVWPTQKMNLEILKVTNDSTRTLQTTNYFLSGFAVYKNEKVQDEYA